MKLGLSTVTGSAPSPAIVVVHDIEPHEPMAPFAFGLPIWPV
jgi:hypothetical protein